MTIDFFLNNVDSSIVEITKCQIVLHPKGEFLYRDSKMRLRRNYLKILKFFREGGNKKKEARDQSK